MVEPLVIVSRPGADARWPLARVSGLPSIERNLMALRSVGATRVHVACGEAERPVLEDHFLRRSPDPRLPEIVLEPVDRAAANRVPALDGGLVYHPELLRRLIAGERMVGRERVEGLYAEDVTTAPGRRRARRAIRRSLRKPTDGLFARYIDRWVSLAISSMLAPFPVHPNAVTVGTLFVGVASGVLAARGTYEGFVAAGVLFLMASVLDGVDGELARMKFQGSHLGQWLDTVCDDLTNGVYLAGLTVGVWRTFHSPPLLWAGVAAVSLDVVTVSFLYWQLITRLNARTLLAFEDTVLAPALQRGGLGALVARLQPLVKRDIYAPLFLVFALAGIAWVSLPATAVALAVTLVFLVRDFLRAGAAATQASA